MYSVLFVCMGNICRSPMAEGVFRHRLREINLERQVLVDSAGTHAYHVGEAPDPRAQQATAMRGYDISGLRARKIVPSDMERFDLVVAMDRKCLESISLICPVAYRERLGLFMDYAPRFDTKDVPDPYYGSGEGFERVLDMVEDGSSCLAAIVKERVSVSRS